MAANRPAACSAASQAIQLHMHPSSPIFLATGLGLHRTLSCCSMVRFWSRRRAYASSSAAMCSLSCFMYSFSALSFSSVMLR